MYRKNSQFKGILAAPVATVTVVTERIIYSHLWPLPSSVCVGYDVVRNSRSEVMRRLINKKIERLSKPLYWEVKHPKWSL